MRKSYLCIYLPEWKRNLSLKKISSNKPCEIKALFELGLWAIRFSPFVGVDEEIYLEQPLSPVHFGLILDMTGTDRLYKNKEALLSRIETALSKLNIKSKLALTPTIGASWALSRFGENGTLLESPHPIKNSLSKLPPSALRIDNQTALSLWELGINTIGSLLALPRFELRDRFGSLIEKRMAQALGEREEVLLTLSSTSLLSLSAPSKESILPRQFGFLEQSEDPFLMMALDRLLKTLSLRIGSNRVKTLNIRESYLPERVLYLSPFNPKKEAPTHSLPSAAFDRPSLLFEEPEPVSAIALLPDHPPCRLLWRRERLRIISGSGPECISEEWWHKNLATPDTREYFKVQDERGRWLWIFRLRKSSHWFIHGVWA